MCAFGNKKVTFLKRVNILVIKHSTMGLPDKAQSVFDKVVAWDRNLAKRFQDKFNLTDYQMLCVSFAKGFVIGAILL